MRSSTTFAFPPSCYLDHQSAVWRASPSHPSPPPLECLADWMNLETQWRSKTVETWQRLGRRCGADGINIARCGLQDRDVGMSRTERTRLAGGYYMRRKKALLRSNTSWYACNHVGSREELPSRTRAVTIRIAETPKLICG
jgi:hypothetical protein